MVAVATQTDATGAPVQAAVTVQSAWFSKINWGEAVKIASAGAMMFFGLDIPVETQNHILMAIIAIGGIYTWAMKTFFTTTVTPSAVTK